MDESRRNIGGVSIKHGDKAAVVGLETAGDDIAAAVQVADIVDPAGLVVMVGGDAHCQVVPQGHVEIGFLGVADVPAPGGGHVSTGAGLEFAMRGFIGDQAHRAGLGTGAEQGALGSRQYLDTVEVRRIHVQVAPAERDRHLIHVQRHRRR